MLKVLEDVPPNVYFILCSSEPAKIISAIKSRCTEIKFKSLSDDQVLSLYRRVLKAEGIRYPIQVLEALVASTNGSPRTALVLLEKSIGLDEDEIITMLEQDVVAATTISICRALLAKETSWGDMAALLSSLETTDWESLRYAVLGYMTSVLLKSKNKIAAMTIECFSEPFYNSGKAGLVLACYKSIVM
jgi:DNA polymerase-3 subunit gamma/tau